MKAKSEMNTLRTTLLRISGGQSLCRSNGPNSAVSSCSQLRSISSLLLSRAVAEQKPVLQGTLNTKAEGVCVSQQPLWQHQQVRTVKRGTEYQPKNIKRKRTHGWIKRISTPSGIEVILRRMLKGRKSLTH
ncbi:39S ribosomal protein L34, mitochondrial [Puntigrus tetrazona]|uniref:39S ribosomal protein L34, mitochondrial n=1 Tax=Puntigrus tetrazona TaxID=1606681 RepID=UPI001C890D86|nr:39S ribosomal protein L34, mitochondrial [Puntigrus tetrazona]